jgi:predicted Zn-dependent protease
VSSSKLDAFRAMAAKNPANALARYGLANELVKAGEYAEARTTLDEYLAAHDDEGAAYRLLGLACEKLGLVEDARSAYRRGVDAATRHGHPSMADEFSARLEDLDD